MWNGLQMRQKRLADYSNPRAAVVEDVFIVLRLCLRVGGDGDCADLDRAEEGVEELRRIQEQEENALFGTNPEGEQGIAHAVGSFQQLLIGDPLVAALDGDFRRAAFLDVAIHEVRGDIERVRQRDQEIGRLLLARGESLEIVSRKRAGV